MTHGLGVLAAVERDALRRRLTSGNRHEVNAWCRSLAVRRETELAAVTRGKNGSAAKRRRYPAQSIGEPVGVEREQLAKLYGRLVVADARNGDAH